MKIFDGHNDTLLNLHLPKRGKERSFFEQSVHGHLDLPRAKTGNLIGGIFAIFVPEEGDETLGTRKDKLIITEDGYEVTYRYKGERYKIEMPYDPGKRIKVRIQVSPVI